MSIPHRTKARLRNALRTAYTAALCLILFALAPWAGQSTYISPALSAVSGVNVYLGMWMSAQYKVAYSNIVCSALGVLCGLFFATPPLLVVLMFSTLVWVSHCTYYDQLAKVIGSISLVLGAIWPFVTPDSSSTYSPIKTLTMLIAIVQVPFLITGLSLLFPRQALAVADSRLKASIVCAKLQAAVSLTVSGFSLPEDVDFFGSKVEHLLSQSLTVLSELEQLLVYVDWEVIFFPQHRDILHSLRGFVRLARACCSQLTGLHAMLAKVVSNTTQQAFALALKHSLAASCCDLEDTIKLIGAFLTHGPQNSTFCFSSFLLQFVLAEPKGHPDPASQDLEAELVALDISLAGRTPTQQPPIPASFASTAACRSFFSKLFERSAERLAEHRLAIFDAYSAARSRYVWEQIKRHKIRNSLGCVGKEESKSPACPSVDDNETGDMDDAPRLSSQTHTPVGVAAAATATATTTTFAAGDEEALPSDRLVALENAIATEIQRLSLRNFGPRAAFMHRYCQLLVQVGSGCGALIEHAPPDTCWTLKAYLSRLTRFSHDYMSTSLGDAQWLCGLLKRCCERGGGSRRTNFSPDAESNDDVGDTSCIEQLAQSLWPYAQPCKIALSICLTSLLVVIRTDSNATDHTGLWACIVVALIRQDSVASSFLVGYQRLEGTVIGAVFSFAIYQGLGTESYFVTIPALVLWLGLCAFFRDGARHGYAAVVAGFTPMVLLLGPTPASLYMAYSRIEKTFLGIFIYLVVDNFVLPVKVESGVKAKVLKSIEASRELFLGALESVGLLMKEVNRQRGRTNSFQDGSSAVVAEATLLQASQQRTASAKENLSQALGVFDSLLKLSVHEPEIWSRAFPQSQYAELQHQLCELSLQGDSLILAIEGLSAALVSLRSKEDLYGLSEHLATFSFMAGLIVGLAGVVDDSLTRVHDSLNILYETGAQGSGFGAICSLSRLVDSLLIKLDEHFRSFYMQDLKNADLDCAFILAWQNVFETSCDTVRCLSKVGECILAVRDVEH